MVGIAGDASHDFRIPSLHRPRRSAQRYDTAGAAERNVIEPSRRKPEMLREPDRGIRPHGKTRYRKSIDILQPQSRTLDELMQRAAQPPLRAVRGISPIRNRDWEAGNRAFIGLPLHRPGHMKSWMFPNAASQLTRSTRLSLILSLLSTTANVWVAQAA